MTLAGNNLSFSDVRKACKLWNGTTEFWTNDMPLDDTWKPNRHHSNLLPLFRNHLTRNAAMFPLPPNPVASNEHGCRDSHFPAAPHTEDAEGKRRRVALGVSEVSNVYSSHHDDPSGATESQDAAAEANPSSQRQDPSEEMSTPPGGALANGTGKGNTCQLRGPSCHSSWTVKGRTKLDLVQDEVDEAKRLLKEAHVEVQASDF